VTEAEWDSCADLDELLWFLQDSGRTTDRKLRLFACACCRRIWERLCERCSRQAVEIAERYADGKASFEELEAAFLAADRVWTTPTSREGRPEYHALDAARLAAHPEMRGLADGTATSAAMAVHERGQDFRKERASEQARQCGLLRDLFGPPLFRPVAIEDGWLAWNGGTVRRLAEAAYRERSLPGGALNTARLGVLADALEEAGCTDADLLGHLRGPGAHVRGCWAVDLLSGRE
jgi:hypothetical protein